jgi:phosphoglycerol geranylgeranyltransferase
MFANQYLYKQLQKKSTIRQKSFAVLLDPDKLDEAACVHLIALSEAHAVDYFFIGGSLLTNSNQTPLIKLLKETSTIPVVLFPSSSLHLDDQADGILLLSLISGRNPEFLIGQHVISAPLLKASQLEILPTGYMLVDTGRQTTASYMSGTTPLPADKPAIAACTAMAGELLGLRLIFLDGGSGASFPVPTPLIRAVRQAVDIPLIVGGGINTGQKAYEALSAGADIIVVGNEIEGNPGFIAEVAQVLNAFNLELKVPK